MSKFQRVVYPFSAITGQEKMKKGLVLNAINPRLGGILVRGEKGTAKSTAVRALAALLPEIEVVMGCPFNCDPKNITRLCDRCQARLAAGEKLETTSRQVQVIDLPVSATEDRVVGSLDFEHAIKHGMRRFEPGILAQANRGIIYMDEVNLLDDHIVDVLLDAAAMGLNVVERESVSYVHPAEFILVGTMNPEEGDLRPQLIDRFGLCVEVEGVRDPGERVEIAKRREAFDADPMGFITQWAAEEQAVRDRITAARQLLPKVTITPGLLDLIAKLSMEAFVAGHRADIIMEVAARTIAAWHGREEAMEQDVYEAADLVLFHRVRQAPPPPPEQPEPPEEEQEEPESPEQENEEENQEEEPQEQPEPEQAPPPPEQADSDMEEQEEEDRDEQEQNEQEQNTPPPAAPQEIVFAVGQPFQVKRITHERDRILRKGSGRRSHTKTASKAGRYVRSTMQRKNDDLAFDATLRAAAPYQVHRRREQVAIAIETGDIREKVREKRIGNFLLFVVDASGSMGAQQRMVETKGAILSLLLDAYQKRDRIGMVAFKGNTAEVILPPTNSVEMAHKLLEELPTGGKTPLSAGLAKAYEVAKTQLLKDPNISPLLIIISDGKGNVSIGSDKPLKEALRAAEIIREEERIKTLVIDVEKKGFLTFGLARELAHGLEAEYYKIDDLKADTLVQAVRQSSE
ncbi:MAG: magnesium chelatase [Firmicutes bacterium HGW-Firmicutes-8]|nr:MAG: magnesium chelatase [Firmicutes bacterium HGW-Firmicutes-8]